MANEDFGMNSEWNEAKGYFFRIHLILAQSDQAGMSQDYNAQLEALYALHRELSGQMKPDELAAAEDLHRKAVKVVKMLRFKNIDKYLITRRVYDYEIYLRKIMKLRKMDMPRSKDPGSALLDG